ncbi:MAG: methyl-accepting chemotaxis protein, partial [Treponemataceae bacterium]
MDFIGFLTTLYGDESLRLKKKSRILAWIAAGFVLACIFFAILMGITGAMVVSGVFVGIGLFCGVVLFLLKQGKYRIASTVFLHGIFLGMFAAIKFDVYVNVYETYVFATLGCFLLIIAALVAERRAEIFSITALDLVAIQALYWLDAFPADGSTVTTLAIQNLAVSSFMVIVSGVVSAYLVHLNTTLLTDVEERARNSAERYGKLNGAMGKAQSDSMRIGEGLNESATRTLDSIEELRRTLSRISDGMDRLGDSLGKSEDANHSANADHEAAEKALASFAVEVSRASSAVEEMTASAAAIAGQTSTKRESVRELEAVAVSGESILASVRNSIDEVLESAAKMMETSIFIEDVAERTNLLGMNASIEAAHAGSAGRGFAIVAGEIRGLSVEASKSSRNISDRLKETRMAIESASGKSGEAIAFFKKIAEDIRGVGAMM